MPLYQKDLTDIQGTIDRLCTLNKMRYIIGSHNNYSELGIRGTIHSEEWVPLSKEMVKELEKLLSKEMAYEIEAMNSEFIPEFLKKSDEFLKELVDKYP